MNIFDPLSLLWTFLLKRAYVVIWLFAKPSYPAVSAWFMNAPQDGKFMIRDIIVYTYIIDSTDLLLHKRIPFFVIFSFLKKQIKRELLYLENTVFLGTTIFFSVEKPLKMMLQWRMPRKF